MKFSGTYFTVVLGDDFTAPELTYTGDGTISYSSDNEEAVTVDATTGAVDIVGAGKAIITAKATETDNFYGASASYTISVANDQGTHEVVDGTFDFSAQHFTDEDLYRVKYANDLDNVRRSEVVLNLDCVMGGIGNGSCGPGPLPKYLIEPGRTYSYRFRISRGRNK